MFEDKTPESILQYALKNAPAGVDTRQGSIYYDAVKGACFKIAGLYADINDALDLVFLDSAVGEYLDALGEQYKMTRLPATAAKYRYVYSGTEPEIGERFFGEGLYFSLQKEDDALILQAENPGSVGNNIAIETPAVPVNNIVGLITSEFGELFEPGADIESDEDYRERIRIKMAGPSENGNRLHYKTWCEQIQGVGRARIIPLFAGENTVMGVLIGVDGKPATSAVVERVQEYVDPITKNIEKVYNDKKIMVGDGTGNGVANIGAHFAAVAAETLEVNISFKAVKNPNATEEDIDTKVKEMLSSYFKAIVLDTPETDPMIIRVSEIGAKLLSLDCIIDYSDLKLNDSSYNINLSDIQAPVIGEVTIT